MGRIKNEIQLEHTKPEEALQYLKEGNNRYINNRREGVNFAEQRDETKDTQLPFATILSCIDSRTSVELIFDQAIGDVFSIRIAGNICNDDILGSIEFATYAKKTKVLLVLGHTSCGAIKGACEDKSGKLEYLNILLDKIKPAMQDKDKDRKPDFLDQVAKKNVELVMAEIVEKSKPISDLVDKGSLKIVGGMYDISSGEVRFLKE